MTWRRSTLSAALVQTLKDGGVSCAVFSFPPLNLNAPAVVVGRPIEVMYAAGGFAIDRVTQPLIGIGTLEHDDDLADLLADLRQILEDDVSLGGVVQSCYASSERNYRNIKVAGSDILLAADLILDVSM